MRILYFTLLLFCSAQIWAQDTKKAITLPDWPVKPTALSSLNSPQRDINLSITPNGRFLYFMSGRGQQPWSQSSTSYKGRPEFDGDIWYAEKKNGQWATPQCLQAPINTHSGEDEPNISADGQTVYFQSWRDDWASTGGPYYRAELRGERWENPRGLGTGITRFFRGTGFTATDGMSIAPNGRVMVVACGGVYDGPMDLFVSWKNEEGIWSVPERLDVCTRGDERSVFIGADSKTLYFASDGWGGFGKLDIFKTTLEGGATTGELINIGQPFNTPNEDYGFLLDAPRNDVYFVREGDIYYANLGNNVDARIKPEAVVIINGTVREKGKGALESNLFFRFDETDDILTKARSNGLSGEYSMSLPRYPGEYTLRVNFAEGYPSIEQKVIIDENTPEVLEISFEVDPAATNEPVVEKPKPVVVAKTPAQPMSSIILFAFDQAVINESSRTDLLAIAEAAKKVGSYTLTIIGHTDDAGSSDYNQKLSERRAKVVADFFASQGLTAKIAAKGESVPAVANDSDGNKAKNRRVEVVLEMM
ncbi:OmpA family protein [Haliscomenobacter sp.]|uniref:OmpA family protein n=1 Tax=Haliscomenobacter sp. TaxID=2717303 RepID=UPI0035940211